MLVQSSHGPTDYMSTREFTSGIPRANYSPRYIGWPVIIRNNKLTADRRFLVGITLLDTRWRSSLATANTDSTRALDRLFQLVLLNLSDRTSVQPYALSLSLTHTHTLSLSLSLSLFSTQTNNILRNVVTIEPPRGCIDSWETLVEGRSIKKWEREVFANTKCLILCRRNSIIIFSEFYRNVTTVHIWYDVSERLNIKSYKDI